MINCLTVPAAAFDNAPATVRMQETSENTFLLYSVRVLQLSDRVADAMSNTAPTEYKLASDIKYFTQKLQQVAINLTPISFPDTRLVFLSYPWFPFENMEMVLTSDNLLSSMSYACIAIQEGILCAMDLFSDYCHMNMRRMFDSGNLEEQNYIKVGEGL